MTNLLSRIRIYMPRFDINLAKITKAKKFFKHTLVHKDRKTNRKKAYLMTLAKKFEENRLTIIGTATLLLLLGAGFQSGIFSSRESMEQFLRQTGVLAHCVFSCSRLYR